MAPTRLAVTLLEDRVVPAGTITEQILIDQIGYRPAAPKLAVFADPINGQNGAVTYVPGSTFQVRRVSDDAIVFTGSVTQWNGGLTHGPSGDRAWHGDFSTVTTPGEYYVYDPATDRRSFAFRVDAGVFDDVLKVAGRVFYYQRSGFEKLPQHAGNWSHAASHLQEQSSQRIIGSTPQGAGTARNVSGGWWDAGDYNKYVPFTTGVLWDLLAAFSWNPAAFSDAWNLPESGDGKPDILNELKWELDWLLRMQLANGSVLNRVGQTSYDVGSGPTADTQPHYYTGPTTWATASFAASTAHAAYGFGGYDPAYAATLRQAAEAAWAYLAATPAMTPASGQDGGTLAAADAGANANDDRRVRVLAAAELYRLTGTAAYKTYFEANYNTSGTSQNNHHPIINTRFDPSVATDLNRALVTYALSPGANPTIVGQIKTALKNHLDWIMLPEFNNRTDPYFGFMWDGHYTWGSNQLKANWANLLSYAVMLDVSPADAATYRQIAEEYLHYFHGRNPLAYTYLTNVGSKGGTNLGADKVPLEGYHGWWPDGSALYDGANSTYGPTPGYVVGGPNQFFGVSWVSPPYGEPAMKAYRDWNTGWNPTRQANENSWEINEPAIYYQAAYVLLLSQFATSSAAPPAPGTGLRGTYHDNEDFTGPRTQRVDPGVDFDWGTGAPARQMKGDTFSVRWAGSVQTIEGGVYAFRTFSDDGARLWVNGQLVIDHWGPHAPASATGTIALAPERKYTIRLDYRELTGDAVVRLEWKRPGQAAFDVVPAGALFPAPLGQDRVLPKRMAADWWVIGRRSADGLLTADTGIGAVMQR